MSAPHLTKTDLSDTKAVLFGSIGAVIESSEMQRAAFNQAFREAGLDWNWERPEYQEMVKQCGGEKRIAEYAEARGEDVDAGAVHARKTAIFNASLESADVEVRPEVLALMEHAKANDLKVGFVTTTGRANVDSMFEVMGERGLPREDFDVVLCREDVSAGKPSPEVYQKALSVLGIAPGHALAVEDSSPSLQASADADVPTLILPGANTQGQDYGRASFIGAEL